MSDLTSYFSQSGLFLIASLPSEDEEIRSTQHFSSNDFLENRTIVEPFDRDEPMKKPVESSREAYTQLVQKAIASIQSRELNKVVTSRMLHYKRPVSLSDESMFKKMLKAYPSAFVYAFQNEKGERWMGATPELLLRKRGNRFETMALAGTQRKQENFQPSDYKWGEKELQEHKVVIEFILQLLKENGAKSIHLGETHNRIAARVVHLQTEIQYESEEDATFWAKILHPTPAVCGLPREKALQFIRENEDHQRDLYAGYIGMIQQNGDADFFVNLRCMRVGKISLELFVGGGIMTDSIADLEWQETQWKAQTLLSLIE